MQAVPFFMLTDLPPCPVETTLLLISDKWVVLILRDLRTGTKRFEELQKSVTGISQKVLTEKLRSMEEHGLVHRTVHPEVPPRVEYSLTDLGKTLYPVLELWRPGDGSIRNWPPNQGTHDLPHRVLRASPMSMSIPTACPASCSGKYGTPRFTQA